LEILFFDTLTSTQAYLLEAIKNKRLFAPVTVITEHQSAGIGSRNNSWIGQRGNFFVSIAIDIDTLPSDLPLASASIYFSFIMKQRLNTLGEEVWLKWPNDFYISGDKVGGTITKKIGDTLVCGIGINLKDSHHGFRGLQSKIEPMQLLKAYLEGLEKFPSWKQVFSEYKIEFEQHRAFLVHIKNEKTSLEDATLVDDGSLLIDGEKVFSLR